MNAFEAARNLAHGEIVVFNPADPSRYEIVDEGPMWREHERRLMAIRELILAESGRDAASQREMEWVDRRLEDVRRHQGRSADTGVVDGD